MANQTPRKTAGTKTGTARTAGAKTGKSKKKKRQSPGIGIALIAVAALALVFYCLGGLRVHRGSRRAQADITANVAALAAAQHQPPVDLNEEARLKRLALLQSRKGILVDDLAAEQRRVLALEDVSKADLARWFSGSAIVGDSLTMAVSEYKWLSAPPVYAKIGVSISPELGLLDSVEIAEPDIIFLCFGMNDIEAFKADVEKFIARYTAAIQRLQENVPNAVIYVNSVFPVSEKTLAKKKHFGYVDLYNEELQKMCDALGTYFIDSTFLPRQNPSFYDADGMHMKSKFYPLWLTYLADVSGLSNDDE